jgi:hypothetical protein
MPARRLAISGPLFSTPRLCIRCSASEREAPRLISSPRPCMLCASCSPGALLVVIDFRDVHVRAHADCVLRLCHSRRRRVSCSRRVLGGTRTARRAHSSRLISLPSTVCRPLNSQSHNTQDTRPPSASARREAREARGLDGCNFTHRVATRKLGKNSFALVKVYKGLLLSPLKHQCRLSTQKRTAHTTQRLWSLVSGPLDLAGSGGTLRLPGCRITSVGAQ